MKANNGYYDVEIDVDKTLLESTMLDDIFHLRDLKQRKLFLNTDIDQCSVFDIVKNIMQYNAEDNGVEIEQRQPILLYITSNGGEVDSGFELIDVIINSKTPVYTINLGYQYAKFLMHDGSNFVYNSGAKAQDQMEFQRRVEERVKSYILSRSKLTSEEYDSKLRVEWYLFADEAKEKGFVDYIIGQDCDIDCVI